MIVHERAVRDGVIQSYRYLCKRGARKFLRRGLDRCDLEQVAVIGLIKACDRYDPASETPFEAYAWLLIVGELMHHVRDFEHLVRVPRWLRRLEKRHALAHERLLGTLEREPTDAEIANEIEVPLSTVRELQCARNALLSGVNDACDGSFGDVDSIAGVQFACAQAEDRLLVERALGQLPPLERTIVLGIYALGMTQSEIARHVGLRARQIYRMHRTALSRMRALLTASHAGKHPPSPISRSRP